MMTNSQPSPADNDIVLPVCAIFRRFLKKQGLKFTTERAMILDAVLAKQEVFEADQLLAEMRDADHRVSKATIYRTLKHLLESKIITEVLIDSRQAHYRTTFGREPKGHLVCMETNQIIEFPTNELSAIADKIARENGFEPVSHRFVIYGVSPEAQKQAQAEEADEE
ncbi:Fur family transcriptional regulator [Poriferisphaera sp. WC338]|uniref:Fur family transcriptional regulator n=1 Tax=Poriferisphaera sp. WC338 TaxID=3425129 RepID=UPI003D81ABA5